MLQITSVGHQVAISIIRTPPPKKRTAPHGGVMFAQKMVNILVFTVFCDQSGLKTVILEQKNRVHLQKALICCHKSLAFTDSCGGIQFFL